MYEFEKGLRVVTIQKDDIEGGFKGTVIDISTKDVKVQFDHNETMWIQRKYLWVIG